MPSVNHYFQFDGRPNAANVGSGSNLRSPRQSRRPGRLRWFSAVGVLVAIVSVGFPVHVDAQPVNQAAMFSRAGIGIYKANFPALDINGKVSPTAGLVGDLELRNVFPVGNVQVKATLKSTVGPLAAQRQLAIRLTPVEKHLPAKNATSVTIPITFDQGARTVQIDHVFSKWTLGDTYRIDLLEDGDPIPEYTANIGNPLPDRPARNPLLLMPDEMVSNIGVLGLELSSVPGPPDVDYFRTPVYGAVETIDEQQFPTDWRLLQLYDCLLVDASFFSEQVVESAEGGEPGDPEELGGETSGRDELAERSGDSVPRRRIIDAIRHWTMAGGVLVCVAAEDSEALSSTELTQRLRLTLGPPLVEGEKQLTAINEAFVSANGLLRYADRWAEQALSNAIAARNGYRISLSNGQWIPGNALSTNPADLRALQDWSEEYAATLKRAQELWNDATFYSASAGSVVSIGSGEIDRNVLPSILQWTVGLRASPMLRRGVDPILGDSRHRRWLIPGVAQPPVYTFIGILTLFVILVGPIAYRWTTRSHRSHLMFLIAPVLALLTTTLMFSYSIVADGFGTLTRVRQLTWIDGASGDAFERSRVTLFAGISPTEGLTFDAESEIYPYPGGETAWEDIDRRVNDVRQRVIIEGGIQRWTPSFLPSRSQTQFIENRIRQQLGSLQLGSLTPFDSGGKSDNQTTVDLTSTLDFELRSVVVRSADGRYWHATRLPAGETVQAKWMSDDRQSSELLGSLYTDYRPVGSTSRSNRSKRDDKTRDLLVVANRQISGNSTQAVDGLVEIWLNQQLFIKGDLPNGSFVGISDVSGDIVPVADAEAVESVRYVMGTMP